MSSSTAGGATPAPHPGPRTGPGSRAAPYAVPLPAGCTQRPLRHDDARAVTALMAAQELADIGEQVIELADIEGDWARPSYDLAASSVGVFLGEQMVGYAEATGGDRGDAAVHPDHRGRGVGTWLAGWMQDRARRQGSREIGMPVPRGSSGDRLLEELGYRVRWTSWVLQLPPGREVEEQPLPEGYAVGEGDASDHRAAWTVVEDAFLEWSVRGRQSFDDWAATTVHRPGAAAWNLRVVTDPTGEVVGAAVVHLAGDGPEQTGYVDQVAVRADRRGLGLARALLADAFAVARAHGATRSELATDSRTGALGLYRRVGMEVTSTWVNRGIEL